MTKNETQKLVRALGLRPLARHLRITHNSIIGWEQVPAIRVKAVVAFASKLGYLHGGKPLTCAALRPDIF